MSRYEIRLRVVAVDIVVVEAESAGKAQEIVEDEGWSYDMAVSYDHDVDPTIEVMDVARLEERA